MSRRRVHGGLSNTSRRRHSVGDALTSPSRCGRASAGPLASERHLSADRSYMSACFCLPARPATPLALVTVYLLTILTSTAVGSPVRPSDDGGHDWCAARTDRTSHLKQLQASLKRLEEPDWELVLTGLDRVYKMTADAWRFSDGILANLVDIINDDETFISGMANVYLTYARKTPEAERFTDDKNIDTLMSREEIAKRVQFVLYEQSKNLAQMLARLELLYQTERDLGDRRLAELMYGSMGETQFVLCAMQHLFRTLSPDQNLSGRYTKSDLDEFEQDTLGTSHHIRMYAAYGVILRHSDVILMVKDDILNLSQRANKAI